MMRLSHGYRWDAVHNSKFYIFLINFRVLVFGFSKQIRRKMFSNFGSRLAKKQHKKLWFGKNLFVAYCYLLLILFASWQLIGDWSHFMFVRSTKYCAVQNAVCVKCTMNSLRQQQQHVHFFKQRFCFFLNFTLFFTLRSSVRMNWCRFWWIIHTLRLQFTITMQQKEDINNNIIRSQQGWHAACQRPIYVVDTTCGRYTCATHGYTHRTWVALTKQ